MKNKFSLSSLGISIFVGLLYFGLCYFNLEPVWKFLLNLEKDHTETLIVSSALVSLFVYSVSRESRVLMVASSLMILGMESYILEELMMHHYVFKPFVSAEFMLGGAFFVGIIAYVGLFSKSKK